MRLVLIGLMLLAGGQCKAESGCFKSVGEAARRAGLRDESGFRAEGVRRDVFSGVEWIRVVRCGRPETPGILVRGIVSQRAAEAAVVAVAAKAERPALLAGDAVRVIWEDSATHGEMTGVAVASGALGARVRVRIEGLAKQAEERFVSGVVRAAGVVELEVGR